MSVGGLKPRVCGAGAGKILRSSIWSAFRGMMRTRRGIEGRIYCISINGVYLQDLNSGSACGEVEEQEEGDAPEPLVKPSLVSVFCQSECGPGGDFRKGRDKQDQTTRPRRDNSPPLEASMQVTAL